MDLKFYNIKLNSVGLDFSDHNLDWMDLAFLRTSNGMGLLACCARWG
jgi:hypothetical protein